MALGAVPLVRLEAVAGVLLALFVPIHPSPGKPEDTTSPLHRLEHGLSPWVSFVIVPIFGFANRDPHWYDEPLSAIRAANCATTNATSVCPTAATSQSQIPTGPAVCRTLS